MISLDVLTYWNANQSGYGNLLDGESYVNICNFIMEHIDSIRKTCHLGQMRLLFSDYNSFFCNYSEVSLK